MSVRACLAMITIVLCVCPEAMKAATTDPSTTLWYTKPAKSWQYEALPIGNGRLGAMIFGGIGHERIALNEETVWSGTTIDWNRKDASRDLPKIRELLLAGKNAEAEALVNQTFTCVRGGSRGGASQPSLPGVMISCMPPAALPITSPQELMASVQVRPNGSHQDGRQTSAESR